jgi:transcriptional regulator with XRE-family HTH domain
MQGHRRNPKASITAEIVFGRVLREIRNERGLSQESLAFESGYHSTYIGQLERGQKSPSLRTIMNLAMALHTPGSEMLRRVEAAMDKVLKRQPKPKVD